MNAESRNLLRDALPERLREAWRTAHRVDLLIGGRLIVEVDGRRCHVDEAAFEGDCRRNGPER